MGDGRRLNPAIQITVSDDRIDIHNPANLPVLVECPECHGDGKANGTVPTRRMHDTIEDVDGLIHEVWAAQPMLRAKRMVLLNRLYRVRHNLEILRGAS
jgi:hypothetical protein